MHVLPNKFVSYITLPCGDIQAEARFYCKVFLLPEPVWPKPDFACWKLAQLNLALLTFDAIAKETGLNSMEHFPHYPLESPTRTGCLLSHNVTSESQVLETLKRAKAASATATTQAQHTSWSGFRGFFISPAGQLWEVCYNPRYDSD